MEQQALTLPNEVVTPTDVARLNREIENLDEFFRQSAIRKGGQPQTVPRYSRLLDTLVVSNELNLLQAADRESLLSRVKELAQKAPVLHVSFSVDPPGAYVQKIVGWLRANIDASILVRIGLQPNIGAGCVVRTTSKSFDFSLRQFFDDKKDFFTAKMHEVAGVTAVPDNDIAVLAQETSQLETTKGVDADEKESGDAVPVATVKPPVEESTAAEEAEL